MVGSGAGRDLEGALEQREIDYVAAKFRARAGLGSADVLPAYDIAVRMFGRNVVRAAPRMLTPACVVWDDGRPTIYVRPTPCPDLNFHLGHELGHVALRLAGFDGTRHEEEAIASKIGAAIVAPPEALRRATVWYGGALHRVAPCFLLSQTSTALRLGEAFGEQRAVVTKSGVVLARNIPQDHGVIVRWARKPPPTVKRTRLAGGVDRGRVALHVA